jgi:hypothetical protein
MAFYRIKTLLYRIKLFVKQSHVNGLNLAYILAIHLPRLFLALAYNKVAKTLNDRLISPICNLWLMKRFHAQHVDIKDGHYYVIVMPNTLHYLIPCLQLIPDDITTYLIFNGAKRWERKKITEMFAKRPAIKLLTLPFSSVNHGPVINLLFAVNQYNFGIIDHDLYIFDKTLLQQSCFTNNQSMRAVFKGVNPITGMEYPHTFWLFFNCTAIKEIMQRFDVDARIYYDAGQSVNQALATVGLTNGVFIKEYMNYFDTLHILLGLSYAQGLEVDYVDTKQVFHLGGTSMGSQYSKGLLHMYMSMRFLEHLNDATLSRHYMPFLKPFSSSKQIWEKLTKNEETHHMRITLDKIIERLVE